MSAQFDKRALEQEQSLHIRDKLSRYGSCQEWTEKRD
jgi:hypothetical protein